MLPPPAPAPHPESEYPSEWYFDIDKNPVHEVQRAAAAHLKAYAEELERDGALFPPRIVEDESGALRVRPQQIPRPDYPGVELLKSGVHIKRVGSEPPESKYIDLDDLAEYEANG